jgi:hypothetical protein
MELLLERKYYKKDYIICRLYIDYKYFCDTLEPPYGALTSEMTGRQITIVKLCSGKLAIPTGSYRVIVNMSPRFKRPLPLLLDIPGFSGIRIHPGNMVKDTEGCILVGWNRHKGMVINSRSAVTLLMDRFAEAEKKGKPVWITIK